MIGYIRGEVIFSDGNEVILLMDSGVGHQIFYNKILVEGSFIHLYISHIVRENSEELFGFINLRTKKLFEVLITAKGVGPKSAYAIVGKLGVDQICEAIQFQNKNILTRVSGVGPKAASQIILDLGKKIQKVKMYSDVQRVPIEEGDARKERSRNDRLGEGPILEVDQDETFDHTAILNDALAACSELGFKSGEVISLAQRLIRENSITRAEQLVHLVLKEV